MCAQLFKTIPTGYKYLSMGQVCLVDKSFEKQALINIRYHVSHKNFAWLALKFRIKQLQSSIAIASKYKNKLCKSLKTKEKLKTEEKKHQDLNNLL